MYSAASLAIVRVAVKRCRRKNWSARGEFTAPPTVASTQLADRVEHLVHAGAKRPDNLVGNLLRKPTELLSLSPNGLELFARVRVGKRNYLGRRLRREELLGKVECGVGVDPGYLDHLHTVIGRALGDGRVGRLEQFCRLLDCGLQFLVAPLRLDDRRPHSSVLAGPQQRAQRHRKEELEKLKKHWQTLVGDQGASFARFREMIDNFGRVLTEGDPATIPIAAGVPLPGAFPARSHPMRGPAELAVFCAGWALLHEIRHIQFQQEGSWVSSA